MRLTGSTQQVAQDWGQGDAVREDRELKHRAMPATRDVPTAPALVRILRYHLAPAQQRSPLAKVPYHLRHAAVSLWLNAGVPATQVAGWAGHSVRQPWTTEPFWLAHTLAGGAFG